MINNYSFWDKYLKSIKEKLINLCDKKRNITIDFHIHSNYSADGKQSLKEIIQITQKLGFDVIAITDHDCLTVYDELFEIIKSGVTIPIIIPGVELTIDNKEYGSQCHILQLFINPKDKILLKNINKNYEAMFERSKIQFMRLKENKAISKIKKDNCINYSYSEYIRYLIENKLVPEYDTIGNYLMKKFKDKNITTFDILDMLKKYNKSDCYSDRKEIKTKQFQKLENRYKRNGNDLFDSHFLMSMLAIKDVDDDCWPEPSSGSLSVNSYVQLHIEELNDDYMLFWAHPTESRLSIVDKYILSNKKIVGLEQNIRNPYSDINNFNSLLNKHNMYRIIGSDSHNSSKEYYKDMSYYKIDSNEIRKIVKRGNDGEN